MATVRYAFEAGPDTNAVTTANAGVNTVSSPNGGSVTYDAANKETGSFGVKLTNAANSQALVRTLANASSTTMSFSFSFRTPSSAPSGATLQVQSLRHSSGTAARFQLQTDMSLLLTDYTQANWLTIRTGLSTSTWYRVSGWVKVGNTGTNVSLNIYPASSNTPLNGSPVTATAFDLGSNGIVGGDSGIVSSPSTARTVYIDNIQWADATATHLAFYTPSAPPPPPPTAASTKSLIRKFNYSASTGTAPLTLQAVAQSGPDVGAITVTGMVAEFTDSETRVQPVVIRFTVTDNNALSTSEDVTVLPYGAFAPQRLVFRNAAWR